MLGEVGVLTLPLEEVLQAAPSPAPLPWRRAAGSVSQWLRPPRRLRPPRPSGSLLMMEKPWYSSSSPSSPLAPPAPPPRVLSGSGCDERWLMMSLPAGSGRDRKLSEEASELRL